MTSHSFKQCESWTDACEREKAEFIEQGKTKA